LIPTDILDMRHWFWVLKNHRFSLLGAGWHPGQAGLFRSTIPQIELAENPFIIAAAPSLPSQKCSRLFTVRPLLLSTPRPPARTPRLASCTTRLLTPTTRPTMLPPMTTGFAPATIGITSTTARKSADRIPAIDCFHGNFRMLAANWICSICTYYGPRWISRTTRLLVTCLYK
jgi:hypothetical protein